MSINICKFVIFIQCDFKVNKLIILLFPITEIIQLVQASFTLVNVVQVYATSN